MNEDDVDRLDRNRRHFLAVATAVTGLAGVGARQHPHPAHRADVAQPVGRGELQHQRRVQRKGRAHEEIERGKDHQQPQQRDA